MLCFFFKQKTSFEMRISDWSSDVCSSDLCPLMQPAADAMAEALAKADLRAPLVPVYANVTAAPVADPDEIRRLLVAQVTGMVRWRESVAAMAEAGVTHFIELGGKVLGPMVKRIAPEAREIGRAQV